MEEAKGILVDTNILISKKIKVLLSLDKPLYITPIVLLEYLKWVIESRNRALSQGNIERAKGYKKLIKLFPELLKQLNINLIEQDVNANDINEVISLILERSVDPGDAINAITAKRNKLMIITGDKDWLRLKDYVVDVLLT